MENRIEQLANWLVNQATQQGLSISQFKTVTPAQVYNALPASQRDRLTQTIYSKAKRLALTQLFKQKLNELKDNTAVRQTILDVFPNATFKINARKGQIMIEVSA